MADDRLCNPISKQELNRRWAAVRAAMPEQKLDALIVQGANNLAGTGGYFRWFTGVSMGTSYPGTVIFPRDGLMTLVSHGPMGVERDFAGNDPIWRGVGKWFPTASFPAIDYCIPYDAGDRGARNQEGGLPHRRHRRLEQHAVRLRRQCCAGCSTA